MTGQQIRQFFRDLLGSRLNAHLEEELLRLRSDYDTRLQERERTIAEQREELIQLRSKLDRWEMVLIPLSGKDGGLLTPRRQHPTFEPLLGADPTSWEAIQADWEKRQRDEAAAELAAQKENHG